MNLKSVKQAIELGEGVTLPGVIGEITEFKKPYKGTGQYGDYTVQNLTLKDLHSGDKLAVALWDHDEVKAAGRTISLSNPEDAKKPTLSMGKDKKTGALQLKATKGAVLDFVSGGTPQQQNLPISQPGANTAPSDVAGVKRYLAKMANAMILGLDAACYVADHAKGRGVEFSNEDIRCLMTSSVIELNKRGYVDVLPVGPMDKPKPKPAPAPVPEPEPDEGPSFEEMVPPDEDGPF